MGIYFRLLWVGMLGVRLVQTHEPQDTDLAVRQVQICGTFIEVPLPWVAPLGVSQMTLAQSRSFWLNRFYHSVQGMWLCWQGTIILSLTLTSFLILLHNPTAPCETVWHFLLWLRVTPVLDIQVRSVGQWYCHPNWAKKRQGKAEGRYREGREIFPFEGKSLFHPALCFIHGQEHASWSQPLVQTIALPFPSKSLNFFVPHIYIYIF